MSADFLADRVRLDRVALDFDAQEDGYTVPLSDWTDDMIEARAKARRARTTGPDSMAATVWSSLAVNTADDRDEAHETAASR